MSNDDIKDGRRKVMDLEELASRGDSEVERGNIAIFGPSGMSRIDILQRIYQVAFCQDTTHDHREDGPHVIIFAINPPLADLPGGSNIQ